MNRTIVLEIMKNIILDYLNNCITREQAVRQLINGVDIEYILNLDVDSEPNSTQITDCYYSIKHLTETGHETSDEEIRYFSECLNGNRVYNLDEKNEMLRGYFNGN